MLARTVDRRDFLGLTMTASLSLGAGRALGFGAADATNKRFPLQRRLIWINMAGGWDLLEVLDPKPNSTPGIDMIYGLGEANLLAGSDGVYLGRWLPRLAALGSDLLVVRGLAMGTTSHNAGSLYMGTGVLSNTGRVNAASISAIVASEGESSIPIIQLDGGALPLTDRGLLRPVSPVRAGNLPLYRSLYPEGKEETEASLSLLQRLQQGLTGIGQNDRLQTLANAATKVRAQFVSEVGAKLALDAKDISDFTQGAPASLSRRVGESFALAAKLISEGLCDCINIGIGGFDTHSNQSARLQPLLEQSDFAIASLVGHLRARGVLDSTLIVVYSDFGRTPKVNNQAGRDHWPVGGALLIGGGLLGGRVVGATDDNLRVLAVEGEEGRLDPAGVQLNPTHIGGTVLALTLGDEYLGYRDYLSTLPVLTRVKG